MNGKVYGPYLYENKRVGDRVITSYVGKPKKKKFLLMKYFTSLFLLFFLFVLLFLSATFSYNFVDNSLSVQNVTDCGDLNTSNAIYFQNQTIVPTGIERPCINITADNITFIGNGFSIVNNTFNSTAIWINKVNVSLINTSVILSGEIGARGIYIENANDSSVINTTLSAHKSLESTGAKNLRITDSLILNYSFNSSFITLKRSNYGEVIFLEEINASGENLGGDVDIKNNSIYVNSTISGLNKSANVTLYSILFLNYPKIFYNSQYLCNSSSIPRCINFSSLSGGSVIFNVSSWSNYSIRDYDQIAPSVNIISPQNISYYSLPINFNISLNENGSCLYSLDNGLSNFSMTVNSSGNGFNATNYTMVDGGYVFWAYCNDSTGNTNFTTYVEFSVENLNISSCGVLDSPNNVYLQTIDIIPDNRLPCINITNENITYNGRGYRIINSSLNSTAFYSNSFNISIENVIINLSNEMSNPAIVMKNSNFSRINNVTIFSENGLAIENSHNIHLIDSNILNYNFSFSRIYFYKTNYGEIRFLSYLNASGTNLSEDIKIGNNSIYVSSSVEWNISANISLIGLSSDFIFPRIVRNGDNICNLTSIPRCYNFTSLNSGTVRFNVSSWSNYSIQSNSEPVISGLAGQYYGCEGEAFSHYFNITNNDSADNVTISVNYTGLFLIDPHSSRSIGKIPVHLYSSILNKSQVGNYSVYVNVSDMKYVNSSRINISVIETNNPPNISLISSQAIYVTNLFNYNLVVNDIESGGISSGNLTLNATFLTGSALFNITSTGNMNFTAQSSQIGSYLVQVCVSDKNLTIVHPNISLCARSGDIQTTCINFSISVNALPTNPVSYSPGGGGSSLPLTNTPNQTNMNTTGNGESGDRTNNAENELLDSIFEGLPTPGCKYALSCTEWGNCSENQQERICSIIGCNLVDSKKQVRPCSLNCSFDYYCNPWSRCTYLERLNDILNARVNLAGFKERLCFDRSGCLGNYTEEEPCFETEELNYSITDICNKKVFVGISEISKSNIVSIDLKELLAHRLRAQFLTSSEVECTNCYNAIKDGNEEGIDCGGACTPCKKSFLSMGLYFSILFWAIGFSIFLYLGISSQFTHLFLIRSLILSGDNAISRGDIKKASRNIKRIEKIYNLLNAESKSILNREITDYLFRVRHFNRF